MGKTMTREVENMNPRCWNCGETLEIEPVNEMVPAEVDGTRVSGGVYEAVCECGWHHNVNGVNVEDHDD